MEELKLEPCPYCRDRSEGKVAFVVHPVKLDFSPGRYQVTCEYCGMAGPVHHTREFAASAWNGLSRRLPERECKVRCFAALEEGLRVGRLAEPLFGPAKFNRWYAENYGGGDE